jgi:hypothetical protein
MREGFLALAVFSSSFFMGCSKVVSNDGVESAQSMRNGAQLGAAVEAAVTALAAAPDEIEGEGFATASEATLLATCSGRAGDQPCVGNARTVTYNECLIPGTTFPLNGAINLEYTSNSCSLATSGDSVTRTGNTSRSTRVGTATVSSADHVDYQGRKVGGGIRLSRVSSTDYVVQILGLHKVYTTSQDYSILHTSASQVTTSSGLLERNGRIINGGVIELRHNVANYNVSIQPQQLRFEASCCFPTSGTLRLTYSGSIVGQGSVNFTGCGTATISALSQQTDIQLRNCE